MPNRAATSKGVGLVGLKAACCSKPQGSGRCAQPGCALLRRCAICMLPCAATQCRSTCGAMVTSRLSSCARQASPTQHAQSSLLACLPASPFLGMSGKPAVCLAAAACIPGCGCMCPALFPHAPMTSGTPGTATAEAWHVSRLAAQVPSGLLPVLEVDGQVITESAVIQQVGCLCTVRVFAHGVHAFRGQPGHYTVGSDPAGGLLVLLLSVDCLCGCQVCCICVCQVGCLCALFARGAFCFEGGRLRQRAHSDPAGASAGSTGCPACVLLCTASAVAGQQVCCWRCWGSGMRWMRQVQVVALVPEHAVRR